MNANLQDYEAPAHGGCILALNVGTSGPRWLRDPRCTAPAHDITEADWMAWSEWREGIRRKKA